jgi:hypothetical protein
MRTSSIKITAPGQLKGLRKTMERGLKAGRGSFGRAPTYAIAEETPTFYGRAFINLGNRDRLVIDCYGKELRRQRLGRVRGAHPDTDELGTKGVKGSPST